MTCRNMMNGIPLGETLAAMTADDFHPDSTSSKFQAFLKGVSTSCKALGYTPEAAKFARRCCFALSDVRPRWRVQFTRLQRKKTANHLSHG